MLDWLKEFLLGGHKVSEVPRNALCPCGSGRKYKRCCLEEVEERSREERMRMIAAEDNNSDPPTSRAGVANRALNRANAYRRRK
jgi:hypothetical protein